MSTYTVTETQTIADHREPSATFEAGTLAVAKRKATREQMFQGTALILRDQSGEAVAYKVRGSWVSPTHCR